MSLVPKSTCPAHFKTPLSKVCLFVFVCAQLPCSLEEGPGSLEAEVIGRCEMPVWVLGTKVPLSAGTASAYPMNHLSSPLSNHKPCKIEIEINCRSDNIQKIVDF